MIKKKLVSTLLTAIITTLILALNVRFNGGTPSFLLFPYSLVFVMVYGLPVSVLSDLVTKKIHGFSRLTVAFIIHISFGLSFIYFLSLIEPDFGGLGPFDNLYGVTAVIGSIIFFVLDEYLRKKNRT